MKSSLSLFVAVALALAISSGGSGAGGPQYTPGLAGFEGVVDRDQGIRYSAMSGRRSTHVLAIRTDGGKVLRARPLQGHLGIPLVAYDGTTGGLSGDGKRLALASYAPAPRAGGSTRFVVVDTKSLRVRRLAVLDGSWSFDAIAPDGSTLYLTQHLRAGKHPVYRVRTYDVRTGVLRGALVDRLEGERDMGGEPIRRASSADGRWAYTLYARRGHEPFVHALDTAGREAFCVDLPIDVGYGYQWLLTLKLYERGRLLVVRRGRVTLATVRTDSWKVEKAS